MENILIDGGERSRDQGREKSPRRKRMMQAMNGGRAVRWVITPGPAAFQVVEPKSVRDGSDNGRAD